MLSEKDGRSYAAESLRHAPTTHCMNDVTSAVERVRICLEDLWNTYFYVDDDMSSYPAVVQDLFEDIERRLFGALLLVNLGGLDFMETFRTEPLPFLVVVPPAEGANLLLVNRPAADGNSYWDAFDGRVGPGEVSLHFMEWFDWNIYGQRSFQYYRVRIHAFEQYPEFVGRDALIDRRGARVLFDPGVQ